MLPMCRRLGRQITSHIAFAVAAFVGMTGSSLAANLSEGDAHRFLTLNSSVGCPTGSPDTCFRDNCTLFPVQLQSFRTHSRGLTSCANAQPRR